MEAGVWLAAAGATEKGPSSQPLLLQLNASTGRLWDRHILGLGALGTGRWSELGRRHPPHNPHRGVGCLERLGETKSKNPQLCSKETPPKRVGGESEPQEGEGDEGEAEAGAVGPERGQRSAVTW